MSRKEYRKPSMEAVEIELADKYALEIHSSVGSGQYVKTENGAADNGFRILWDTPIVWGD